jgi:hypothetical protein
MIFAHLPRRGAAVSFCVTFVLASVGVPLAAAQPNTRASRILGMFDIDGGGVPDLSPDSDGDGLPDSWESGGLDLLNTDVPFSAPQAIVPGTPPVSLFSRRPVRTSASSFDSDGDGLSDFIEVFGLMFIDDNFNGVLDDACARDAAGNPLVNPDGTPIRLTCECLAAGTCFRLNEANVLVSDAPECVGDANALIGEWFDYNADGMPSIGEFPAVNLLVAGAALNFDYDGFVFTDPTNGDTDGDGLPDGVDNDPLVNPRSFGVDNVFFPSGTGDLASDRDKDNDGLGNGLDLGNDVDQNIDNPSDLNLVIELLRSDLLASGADRVPEGLLEDLLAADWNGDGVFRLTDIQTPHFGISGAPSPLFAGGIDLFKIENPDNPAGPLIPLGFANRLFPGGFSGETYFTAANRDPAIVPVLPYQEILRPIGRRDNVFLPDPRVWTVLYSWRMPGVDVDGNGFIGYDSASFSGLVDLNGVFVDPDTQPNDPSTNLRVAGAAAAGGDDELDGVVNVSCGGLSLPFFGVMLASMAMLRFGRVFVR